MTDTDILAKHPPLVPTSRLVWTALVEIDDRQDLGETANGHRFMVPILGGQVHGAPGFEAISGKVLSGGADRQLLRPDGAKELDALYEIKTHGGTIITVRNRVITEEPQGRDRYAMSHLALDVPKGPLDWLTRRLLVGTLQSARPERKAVIIRVWMMDTV